MIERRRRRGRGVSLAEEERPHGGNVVRQDYRREGQLRLVPLPEFAPAGLCTFEFALPFEVACMS